MKTAEKTSKKLKTIELALLIGLAIFLSTGVVASRTQDAIAEKVLRLHVLANSDSDEDQALKLLVRDEILRMAEQVIDGSTDRAETEALLRGQLLEFERAAAEVIAGNGYTYPVTVELADSAFPTREYNGFTLPAGEYLALRVLIGEASGQNWWCVVFPPLCTVAATDVATSALAAGLEAREVSLITAENDSYILKFKTIELWEQLRQLWE